MATRDLSPSLPPVLPSTEEKLFPRLTREQVARLATHGRTRSVTAGEILMEVSDPHPRFFVVVSGEVEVVAVNDVEQRVAAFGPGQFTGEVNLLAGRRSLVRVRVTGAGTYDLAGEIAATVDSPALAH